MEDPKPVTKKTISLRAPSKEEWGRELESRRGKVYSLARRMTRNKENAEDVTQNTLERTGGKNLLSPGKADAGAKAGARV